MSASCFSLSSLEVGLGDSHTLATYLSPHVHEILCPSRQECMTLNSDVCAYKVDGLVWLDIERVHKLIPNGPEDVNYFKKFAKLLVPTMDYVKDHLSKLSSEELVEQYFEFISWLSCPKLVQRCLEILSVETSSSSVHAILLLTTVLERSLGNVYLLKGKKPCPSMLKDLLSSNEILDIFETDIVSLMKVLIGPPQSLNIRNVTWHGFLSAGEMHSKYGYFIFILMCTLGRKLKYLGHQNSIPQRPVLFVDETTVSQLKTTLMSANLPVESLSEIIAESLFITPNMRPFWHLAVDMYTEKRFGESCCLLLPQLEHGLRRVFACANGCAHRILTAESTNLFTTFDEILSLKINELEKNKLFSIIEHSYLVMLLDIIQYADGPHIRDHISHGEMDILKVEDSLAYHIITVAIVLCIRFLPERSVLWQIEWIKHCSTLGKSYTSVFHHLCVLSRKMKCLSESLVVWSDIKSPCDIATLWHEKDTLVISDYTHLAAAACWSGSHSVIDIPSMNTFFSISSNYQQPNHLLNESTWDSFQANLRDVIDFDLRPHSVEKRNILFRLLQQIVNHSHRTSEQIIIQSESKFKLFVDKKLRSRQRHTYQFMLDSLIPIWLGLKLVFLVCTTFFVELTMDKLTLNEEVLIRHLKGLLQCSENMEILTALEKNKWKEAEIIANRIPVITELMCK